MPFQISDQAQMETVVEVFCKDGTTSVTGDPQCVSQIFTGHLTKCMVCVYRHLMGIIIEKDMMEHVAEVEHQDPNAIRYH